MTVKYYAILTNQGAARLANATMLGSKLNLTQMAVGDANGVLPTPDPAQTKLINQKRIAPLNLLSVDPNNQSQIIAEQIIPENEGGFWIREIGLYDDEGVLIAVANCPETYKPQLQEGSGRTQTIRMILVVSNTEAITLKIDPSVVLATRKYVDDKISEHEQSRRHPDASLTAKGFTQLSSATNSTSETLAATPRAVKVAYDLANGKYTAQDATTARKGLVQLSSATNSDSETLAATPKAVKTAYDLANGKYTAQDATTARKGLVQLSSATNSTSETQAATPKAVKAVYDLANGKQPADATLTALAGLATAADKLPYFTGNDTASLTTLTNVGRDILAKTSTQEVIQYIGCPASPTGWLKTGNNGESITTAQLVTLLQNNGAFNTKAWFARCAWSYATSASIPDSETGCGIIPLAGAVIEVFSNNTDNYTIRITTATTTSVSGALTNAEFIYVFNVSGSTSYSPGWRRAYNTKNKPTTTDLGLSDESGYVGRLISTRVFTSSGTYIPTPGTKRLRVTITGGGGGGGGCKATSNNETFFGAGGGAGGTIISIMTPTQNSYPVTIGAGGAGGVSATNGTRGGNSVFASLIAPGGAGGGKVGVTNTNGGNGGVPSTGDIRITGGDGGDGQSGNISVSGEGGTSHWGGGGRAGAGGGVSGKAYGSGGGGAYDAGYSGTSMTGGKGAAGICIIEEFA
ncbi:phage tail-collar fiber domain-containing protein [Escherichia coli]|uniref:phage tail-collar fiber domain-containing protein n=4 Tax=Escherichia coli TaxID=562 RepID=UPI0005308F8F|nr:phage tail protein [Escherichia coli]UWF79787.1 MAG: tail-collar fiber protein [Bacteriophage sp.]EIV3161673.1 phage tail protein [Escherichia coli]EJL8176390.1 phage tail protein [Escherichia coli]ELE1011998.1 phage tail protein [Escherichia coli]ELM5362032.1 phage tail protein [Escherichia coli]